MADRVDTLPLTLPIEDGLASLTGAQFDYIFLSDVLMFYFHSYDPSVELDPAALLTTLAGLLAPGGRIAILEPNGAFWQQPWLGSPQRPLTVLSEYRHRWHGVTPTLEELSRAAEAAGLAIAMVRELVPAPTRHRTARPASPPSSRCGGTSSCARDPRRRPSRRQRRRPSPPRRRR